MASSTRTRMSATERGAQVLDAAVTAFAESGYAATRTDEIARLAGVSQPYVIRLFGSKQQLFRTALHQVCDRIEAIFRAAAEDDTDRARTPEEALCELGQAYNVFLTEREPLLVLLHGFAASADPAIGDEVRDRFGKIYRLVRELTGATTTDARRFLATGMLLTVMSAMQVAGPDAVPAQWASEILDDLRDNDA